MHDKVTGASLPSAQALAYLGDAVHSVYVRGMLIERGLTKSGDLNKESLKYVTAEAQAAMYRRIKDMLLDDEAEVFRRASNSTHLNCPRRAKIADYRHATGFEAVLGMLKWIKDEDRLEEILAKAHEGDLTDDTEN